MFDSRLEAYLQEIVGLLKGLVQQQDEIDRRLGRMHDLIDAMDDRLYDQLERIRKGDNRE